MNEQWLSERSEDWLGVAEDAAFIVDPGAVNPGPVASALQRAVVAAVKDSDHGNRFSPGDPLMAPARLIMSQLEMLVGRDQAIGERHFDNDYDLCQTAREWRRKAREEGWGCTAAAE